MTSTSKGQETLRSCLCRTDDGIYNELKMAGVLDESKFLMPIMYHRACYQSYPSKENMAYKQSTQDQGEKSGSHSNTTRSSLTAFDKTKCIFCNCAKTTW